MTGSRRASSSALLVLLLLSGCMGGSPPGSSSTSTTTASHTATQTTPPGESFTVLNFTAAPDRAHYGVEVTVEVLQSIALNFTAANQRRDDPAPPPMSPTSSYEVGHACGGIDFKHLREGEPILAWAQHWTESRGHLAFIATGEEPTVFEDGASAEALVGGVNFTWVLGPIETREGDLLKVRVARDNQGRVFDPYALLDAAGNPALRVLGQRDVAFTCGANLQDFRGTFIQQGRDVGSVVGHDLEWSGSTGNRTDVLFFLALPYGGSCHVRVEVAGIVLGDSGPQVGHELVGCEVAGQAAPGPVRLLIPEVAGTGPALLYFIWDVA